MAAGGSHTKFKIPKKATIPEKPQEPEKAAGAVDIKSKIQGTTSLEHNRPGKKSKVPVRKQHEVQMSVKNQPEVQPEASERRQHDVLTVGRMENENEVPSKASAIKGHQIVAKESFPQALANEKTTEETSADKHNFLLPSVPLRKPPKVKPQSYMGSLLSDGFSHYHDFKVDKAKIDPLEQYQLEDQDLDYEEDPAENDDAISIFAESIFPIEESEEDLLQKVKHDDSDDDSSVASFGSSRNTSDSESDETQNFWTAKEQENSEVLVQHVDDNVSASHKEPVLGVPVENYHKSNQMSGFVDYLCNQDLNTKASNEVPLISDKPSHKKTICDDRRENMKGVSRSICANTVSNDQSGDQSFKKNIFGRDEETQQQTDLGIGSSFAGITSLNQSKDSGNADFPNACQNKPSFSKGVQNPQCQTENRPLQALPRRIQTEKSQTERASSKHQVPLNPRQPLLPTPVFHPVVPNMPMELINYPSADSSSVFSFPILSSTRCSADTMSNHEGKDKMMVDHHMLGKTDTDLRTIGATNFRISSQVPSIGPEVEEFLRPFCLKFLSSGMCSVDNCTQSHKLPDIRLLVNLRDRSLMRKIFDSMISKYDFWMENKLPEEVQELGNENNRNLLLAISTHLWKKLTSKEISKDYSYLWKNVADALSACGLSPNKVLKQILNSMEKESTTTIYYALDNMFEVLFDDYIKDQDLIGDSLKALNLANYQLPEKVLKEFLKAVLKFKSVDMPVCQYLLTMPEKWRPRKLVEHDIFHLIIKLASKLHSESPKTCSDLMKHFDISLQSLNISRSCPDSSSPKMRGGKSTHRFSLQHIDLNIESQGLGSDISSSKRVTPEESTVSSENSTKNCSTREEEVTSSTEEVKTEVQTSDLALTKTQPKEEAHQSKPAFTDKISIKVDSTKRVCSMLTQNPNSVDTDKVKKTAPRRVGKSDDLVRAVKSGMMGTAAKILLAGQPSDRLDIKIYEELKNFSAVKRCDMYSKLFEPIKRSWSLNRNHSSSKAAMIRIGLLLVNDLISERFWQKAEEVLSRIAPLMDVMSEVEIESISTSTLMLMKVQVNIHNNSERKKDLLVEAFREFMQCELFRKEGEWLIPNLEEDVGRRDEVANDLLEKCMECKELVDNAETLFKEMLKFRESYRTFDVASKFYDKILRALLKARKVPAAFRLFGWAHDSQQLTPNVSTCRALCFAVTTLDENDQRCFSPLIVLLMEQAPYKDALFRQTGLYTITLPSIWFCCEVRCIMRYVLNAHVSNLQEIPEIVINIQETSVPEDDLHGVKVVDASSSAMMMRVVEALQPFKLFSPTEQWKDNSITLDAELVKKYVANQRRNVRTNQETASKCLSSRGQHILGARPGSHMPRPEGRGAQRLMSERGEHHEGYGYQQVSRFQTWQQSAFGQMQSPQLTSPTMSGNPPEEARWQQTTSHPSSYLQQSRQEQEARRPQPTNPPPSYLHLPIQDQEANWSQNTPPPQLYPPYQPTYPHPPSYNLRNSFPPHGPTASQESRTAGNFRGRWNRGRGAYRGHRRPTRPLFS